MKVAHENQQLEEIANELVLACVKFDLNHRVVTHTNHFAYEVEINEKIKKGIVLHVSDKPSFIPQTDPNTWTILNKQFKNPYVCCDNIYLHITDKEDNYFCIHHNFLFDEILSYLH